MRIPAYESTAEEDRTNWQGRTRFDPRSVPTTSNTTRSVLGWTVLAAFVAGFVVVLTLMVI